MILGNTDSEDAIIGKFGKSNAEGGKGRFVVVTIKSLDLMM